MCDGYMQYLTYMEVDLTTCYTKYFSYDMLFALSFALSSSFFNTQSWDGKNLIHCCNHRMRKRKRKSNDSLGINGETVIING